MTSSIVRKGGSVTAKVAVLLGIACLLGACSSSSREETTGSIARPQASVGSATPMPPVINAPSTVAAGQPYVQPVAQPVAYAPPPRPVVYAPRPLAYLPRAKACTCSAPQRYDVTASIPRAQPAAPAMMQMQPTKMQFLVHTIAPHETLYSISRMYRTRVSDLATVNRMNENAQLRYGELLVVPTAVH